MLFAPLLLSVATAAQVPTTAPVAPAPPAYAAHRGGRLFISPMGEPFRPSGREDNTLADWFNHADRNHDGRLTLEEMQQDADRFFATLDVSRDGEIDPDDITRYENVVAPEIQSGASYGLMEAAANETGGRGGGRGGGGRGHGHGYGGGHFRGGSNNDPHQGAGRFGLLDLPEPVVSADSNFNRGVSTTEFRQAAAQRFMALDLDHHGYLTISGLETIRPAPPAAPKSPQKSRNTGESASPDPGY